jgi:hypothetical protein
MNEATPYGKNEQSARADHGIRRITSACPIPAPLVFVAIIGVVALIMVIMALLGSSTLPMG